ncbi:hypothetical protein JTB14_009684 [Gonioctena quinquepunctata]|nr:hypothetical protein JTB14_009684 [Gonioctena quinquepunctata]
MKAEQPTESSEEDHDDSDANPDFYPDNTIDSHGCLLGKNLPRLKQKKKVSKLKIAMFSICRFLTASDNSDVLTFVKNLEREFKVTVGPLDFYLGMQIIRLEDGSLFLNQNAYARKILKKYRMSECNAVTTPCEGMSNKDHEEALLDDEVPYRQAVGSLMYLMMATSRYFLCSERGSRIFRKANSNKLEGCQTNFKVFERNLT